MARGKGPRTRRVSRGAARRLQLEAAACVRPPSHADVVVCGGGAAGLACAIAAAEAGALTVVVERDLEAGRTILATGNGRCNFSNERLEAGLYHNADFVRQVTGDSWEADVLDFFEATGIAWVAEGEGRLYPMSRQAASVRECLLDRARRAGAILACAREVTGVEVTGDGPVVSYAALFDGDAATLALSCASCVVACGHAPGLAGLGLPLPSRPLTPVLCPIACADETLASLDGRRVHAHLSLEREGETLAEESGEVLMRTYGISGIAAFNLSRHARPGDTIVCDLMAGLGDEDARRIAGRTLKGVLDPAIADALEASCESHEAALERARAWRLEVTGLAETERAQVMRGGLAVAPFSPASLEASGAPGIFACGEALDVDGPCGGYNLAWAWKSGMVAGTHAAARAARLASGAGARTA